MSSTTLSKPPALIVIVAVPALNVAATPLPTKLIVPAVPTADPSSLITTPDPEPTTPVSPDPSPLNCVAVIIPVTFTPSEFAVIPVQTSRPFFTLKFSAATGSLSPVVYNVFIKP